MCLCVCITVSVSETPGSQNETKVCLRFCPNDTFVRRVRRRKFLQLASKARNVLYIQVCRLIIIKGSRSESKEKVRAVLRQFYFIF